VVVSVIMKSHSSVMVNVLVDGTLHILAALAPVPSEQDAWLVSARLVTFETR